MTQQAVRSFKDKQLSDYPRVEKPHVGTSGDVWADLVEGDLRLVSPGKYEVASERYTYWRFQSGSPHSPRNSFSKGEILLTKDCKEKDAFGQ